MKKYRDIARKRAKGGNDSQIHVFCIDFCSALLANILHASCTIETLESNQRLTEEVMDQLLSLITYDEGAGTVGDPTSLPTSTLIHCLICLSYLSKERFGPAIESSNFMDRISSFVGSFS